MAKDKELTPEQIRDGHIERFKQGVEAWNAWAEEMLREKEALEEAGKWNVNQRYDAEHGMERNVSSIIETQNWLERAFVNFSVLHFVTKNDVQDGEIEPAHSADVNSITVTTEIIDFSDFIFPGDAQFNNASFTGHASFSDASFTGHASFDNATFTGDAWFSNATFPGDARFDNATFTGDAWFTDATLTRDARFDNARFTGNAWFSNATFPGDARFDNATFTGDALFSNARFTGDALFSNATFTGDARLGNATFTGGTLFRNATFTGDASFREATFTGPANFRAGTFTGPANFREASFTSSATFREASFTGHANFLKTTFTSSANFSQADFNSLATFANSKFKSKADFEAIRAERGFTLADATFDAAVPGFIQAHFEEAPRLDNVAVPKSRVFKRGNRETEAKYRALKRLAIQAHDHGKELEFFAGEIRARRHASDRLISFPAGTLRYFSGFLYDIFSDFGRSIWRPLILFAVVFYAFTQLYIHQATDLSDGNCANSDKMTASYAAYTIAAKNSLLFLGTDRTDKIKRAYTCLYGAAPIYEKPEATAGNDRIKTGYENVTRTSRHMAPNVPWAVSALGTAHSILSLILIFLLLLAIRNQFKIK